VLLHVVLLAVLATPAAATTAPWGVERDGLRAAAEDGLRRAVVERLALQGTELSPDALQVSELWAPSLRFTFGFRARAPGKKIYGTGHLELVHDGSGTGLLAIRQLDLHQRNTVFGAIDQRIGALGRKLGALSKTR
jgi:hypothetical protein